MVVGVLALAVLPAAIAAARYSARMELLDAAFAIPVAALLAIAAIALGGKARLRVERTLGRARGARAARLGRLLGGLALLGALTAAGAVGVYAVLTLVASD